MRKKGILSSVVIAVFAIFLIAGTVMAAWSFAFPISVSDTSGADREYAAVLTGVTGASLSGAGYMNATGTDTNMQIGSTSVPFMLSTTQIATVAPILYSGSRITYNLYTGYDPVQTLFSIITGMGGYITTSDDDDLELGDTFIVETKGYVDTDSGADKNLIYKEVAFITYVSGEDEISSEIAGSISEFSSTSDGSVYAEDIVYATAQAAATGTVDDSSSTFSIGQSYYSGYPTVEGTNGGTVYPLTTSHTVNLPVGVSSGDLLLVLWSTQSTTTPTFPDGWIQLFLTSNLVGAWYKIAAETEGASITVTTSSSVQSAHISYRITGYRGVPECGTAATGTSTAPDSPSLNPSWGTENTLWIALEGTSAPNVVAEYPASYTDGLHYTYGGGGPQIGSARRTLNAASEDPGVFTNNTDNSWVANTIAIAPSNYKVDRGFLFFDTSAIPDGATIASANLYLYGETDESDTDFTLTITNGQPTYPTDPLAVGDFDVTHYSGNGGELTTVGFNVAGYNTIPLSATGLTWIDDTGTTKLCIQSSEDIAVSAPTGDEYVAIYAAEEAGTDKDPYLLVTYWYPVVTVSNITSGVRTVKTTADGAVLLLQVYDENDDLIGSDTVALGGASVPDNDNDYLFGQNDVAPYFTYIKMTTAIGGTSEKLWYQPVAMITATTLPDRDTADDSQDGTITWGSNSDMTITMDSVISFESSSSTAGVEDLGFNLPEASIPGGWFGGDSITGLPLYGNFSDISEDTGIPIRTLYVFGVFSVALAMGFGTFMVFKPMLISFIVALVVLWAGASMGIIPGWIIFSFIVCGFGIIYLRRQM